jgi:hypothetical protein
VIVDSGEGIDEGKTHAYFEWVAEKREGEKPKFVMYVANLLIAREGGRRNVRLTAYLTLDLVGKRTMMFVEPIAFPFHHFTPSADPSIDLVLRFSSDPPRHAQYNISLFIPRLLEERLLGHLLRHHLPFPLLLQRSRLRSLLAISAFLSLLARPLLLLTSLLRLPLSHETQTG